MRNTRQNSAQDAKAPLPNGPTDTEAPAANGSTDPSDPTPDSTGGVGDVFDNLEKLRVDQSYGSGLKTRKPFTQCPLRKPRAHDDKVRSQHAGGLALDAARFIRKDGSQLDVLDDFKGRRGSKTCGKKARKVKDAAAIELREIVCEAVEQHLFTVTLTPNFNRAHKNHFHLELTPDVKWFWVR